MDSNSDLEERRRRLWTEFHLLAEIHAPTCRFPEVSSPAEQREFTTDGQSRPAMIANPQAVEAPMKKAHDGFAHDIRTTEYTQAHVPGTEGIVSSTTKTYLPVFLASLRMLRYTGCTLPVELFLSSERDYDRHLCEMVLPLYDVSCIVLSRVFNSSNKVDVQHPQLKAFAVLFSSFEDVIYMDTWNLPTYRTATTRPCADDSLTTWPGHWASTVNEIYYNISGQPVPSMAARPSSNTSAFFVSKQSHLSTLFLNAYYNYHGPSYYYPLFMQGAPGDPGGDSLLLAAAALGRSFLMIEDQDADVGYQALNGKLYSSAVVQINPQNYYLHRVACFRNTAPNRFSFFNYSDKQLVRQAREPFGLPWLGLTRNNKLYRLRTQWATPQGELSRLTDGPEWDYWKNVQSTNCILQSAADVWKEAAAEHWKGLQNDICLLALWYWKMASQSVPSSPDVWKDLPLGSQNGTPETALPPISERRKLVTNSLVMSHNLASTSHNSMLHSTLPPIPEVPERDSAPPSPLRESNVDDYCLSCCRGAYRLNNPLI